MSVINAIGTLGYNITNGVVASAMSMGNNFLQGILGGGNKQGGELKYYYNYRSEATFLSVHAAPIIRASAQYAKDYAMEQLGNLLNGAKRDKKSGLLYKGDQTKSNWNSLIENYTNTIREKHYGMLEVSGGYIPAINNYGEYCPEAFIMGIKLDKSISYTAKKYGRNGEVSTFSKAKTINGDTVTIPTSTNMLVWFDPVGIPSINSDRNIILTNVQGRDYSRKEIVSNGDVKFSVTGNMCSGVPGVYPEDEVKKFIQIMNFKGVVYCNHYILSLLGINKFVVTSWNLNPRQGFGDNEQDYTFSAVGVMPDKETQVEADTINILDYRIQEEETKKGKWAKFLDDKLEGLKNGAMDTAGKAIDNGINSLIGKI